MEAVAGIELIKAGADAQLLSLRDRDGKVRVVAAGLHIAGRNRGGNMHYGSIRKNTKAGRLYNHFYWASYSTYLHKDNAERAARRFFKELGVEVEFVE